MFSHERTGKLFVEIGFCQEHKAGNLVCGDTFMMRLMKGENRYVCVLSDGLGSGIKANVLSTMTASMAMNFIMLNEPLIQSAQNIMNTLPVDSVRNISYATFTIVDVSADGETTVAEFDNPSYILLRNGSISDISKEIIELPEDQNSRKIFYSRFKLFREDKIILFSDGVQQSGMGQMQFPFGWERDGVCNFVNELQKKNPGLSAREMSKRIVKRAIANDQLKALDDITCAVIYVREPRRLLICSGPPFNSDRDGLLAKTVQDYPGKKIICGGTTSKIISRELGVAIDVDIETSFKDAPPSAFMEGIDLVTEGILTLGNVTSILERQNGLEDIPVSPAGNIIKIIAESDMIDILVGTRINQAHQDPSLPVELEIRRNVIKRISNLLEEKYLKKVTVKYL